MKRIKNLCILLLIFISVQVKANDTLQVMGSDSLTLAQAYINLSLTQEYFDTLTITRISKILPFVEKELASIKDKQFIKANRYIYNVAYALLYFNKTKLLFTTNKSPERKELTRLKYSMDKAVMYFNRANLGDYFSLPVKEKILYKESNSFNEFIGFNEMKSYALQRDIESLKGALNAMFNEDIYPDFKRVFYLQKRTGQFNFNSLSRLTTLYGMALSRNILDNKRELKPIPFIGKFKIGENYQTGTKLDLISSYLQLNYMINIRPRTRMSKPGLDNLYTSYFDFDEALSRYFKYDNADAFFKKEINESISKKLYYNLRKRYPHKFEVPYDGDIKYYVGQPKSTPQGKYFFPVPVPFPSAFRYTANFQPALESMKEVDNYLSGIFNKAGYKGNLHYYYVQPGFAISTGLEKINKDGSPVSGSTRWSASIGDNNSFSFYDVFKSIFFDTKSDYRMFALVVSIRGVGIQKGPSSLGAMEELVKYSYPSLPKDLEKEVLPYKTLSAFAYLFHQSDVGEVPMLDVSRRLTMETHLQKSGLGELLR